jgi:hypothetical protein
MRTLDSGATWQTRALLTTCPAFSLRAWQASPMKSPPKSGVILGAHRGKSGDALLGSWQGGRVVSNHIPPAQANSRAAKNSRG